MTVSVYASDAILAQGLINKGLEISGQLQLLIKAVLITIVLGVIVFTAFKTKLAAGAMISSIFLGAIAIWGVTNIQLVSDQAGQDLSAPAAVIQVAPPAPTALSTTALSTTAL